MSDQIKIIIDDREHAVIPHFDKYNNPPNITHDIQRITIGDYSVVYNEYILISIERKTWKDLAQSIKDGRKDNITKMIKLREETSCQLIYLIEGNPIPNPKTKFCRISYKNLRSHLDHLMMRDNVHIIHSKNQKNTVDKIFELVTNYLTIKPSPLLKYGISPNTDGGAIIKLKKKTIIPDETIVNKIWCCIPCISETSANIFIKQNYHISDLILGNITKDQIYLFKYENGHLIGKLSSKIWNYSRVKESNNKYFIKMLTQINGITTKTAKIILDIVSLEKLLVGDISLDTLCKINKTEKRTVGQATSTQILKFFSRPIQPENI